MHPIITCLNCGQVMWGKAFTIVDVSNCDITCVNCGEIYRMTMIKLHDGKPQNRVETEARLAYTYDENHNRITLAEYRQKQLAGTEVPNVPGQAIAKKQ